ncbi:MAG: Holliday junction branch migration protein RuvA [Alphaproteobacteria bacterium]|nr:Holliday junction branch migration protein RuvA [Alphaproteobacteria bacterium]
MIGRLRGVIAALGEGQVLIDVGGVGYLVQAGSRTLQRFAVGEAAELFIETQMSETAIRLYAFLAGEERAWFARLQDAPGVGAKVALAILDVLPPAPLMDAIALADVAAITRAHGVGKKLAERIVTEFRGKAPPMGLFASNLAISPSGAADVASPASGIRAAAVSALVNLGYGHADAARAVADSVRRLGEGAGEPDLIRAALKTIAPAV